MEKVYKEMKTSAKQKQKVRQPSQEMIANGNGGDANVTLHMMEQNISEDSIIAAETTTETTSAIDANKMGAPAAVAAAATASGANDDDDDDTVVMVIKVDKSVNTNDTLEDLQRALMYEAIFSTLIEKKVLAIKRDCEERKRAKRMKRKSIGRIFFSRKLFGGSTGAAISGSHRSTLSRMNSAELISMSVKPTMAARMAQSTTREAHKTAKDQYVNRKTTRVIDNDIEIASASTESNRSQIRKSKTKTANGTNATAAIEMQPNADDSLASTLSNSSDKPVVARRSLLVRAQTHTHSVEVGGTSSSSADSKLMRPGRLSTAAKSNTNGSSIIPITAYERTITNETTSLASGYDNGTGARLHTSTLADGSLTSLRDSIDSISFASSRCTVSFGGTEIIPEDTASLVYERARAAKRLRVLEAKSISAQCSPIFPRHTIKTIPAPLPTPPTITHVAKKSVALVNNDAACTPSKCVAVTTTSAQMIVPRIAPPPRMSTAQTQTAQTRFLPQQVSYTDSYSGAFGGIINVGDLEAAYTRYFSRQNTSEDSANLTVSTLLNQSDSMSLNCAPGAGNSDTSGAITQLFSLGDRYKSKSTSLLVTSNNGRSRPPPLQLISTTSSTTAITPISIAIPMQQLEHLHLTTKNIGESSECHLADGMKNMNQTDKTTTKIIYSQSPTLPIAYTTSTSTPPAPPPPHDYPVSTTTSAVSRTSVEFESNSRIATTPTPISSFHRNGGIVNGAIVTSSNMPADTAKLNRMTSTSTGSSVAPTGCCTTTKSSAREKEKQRFKPSWPSGQSGSDDEYRRRKRKYKRYHRCSDPVLVYPTPSGLQHCILSMPPNDPMQFSYNEDYTYDIQLQIESDKNDDLEEIVPNSNRRHRKHRHHKHKKRHRHKKPKILVQDLETQVVKVIDPDDLPQRARWTIIATACLLLLMCLMLVGITLRMAPIIDDMEMQKKCKYPTH